MKWEQKEEDESDVSRKKESSSVIFVFVLNNDHKFGYSNLLSL